MMICLVSQDKQVFYVPKAEIMMSSLIQTMFDEEDEEEANGEEGCQEIPLPNVESNILSVVLEFVKHYQVETMATIAKVKKLSRSLLILFCADFLPS